MKTLFKNLSILSLLILLFSCGGNDDGGPSGPEPEPVTITDFNLLTVANNSSDVEIQPTLTWENATASDGSAVSYTVFLDKSGNEPNTAIAANLNSNTFTITGKLNLYTDYVWRVEANTGNITKAAANTFGFTTRKLNTQNPAATTNAAFSARSRHTSLFFNNKYWIIGGADFNARLNDVWNSDDGVNWTQVTAGAGFSARFSHTSVVYDDKMWVIGGSSLDSNNNPVLHNDVWYSTDGITWVEANKVANFDARFSHTSVVFDNYMWVIGGYSNSSTTRNNDVWKSNDGVNWNQVTMNAAFSARNAHDAVVFNDTMYIIGGFDSSGRLNDVWSTTNGLDWTEETTNAPFTPRTGHKTVVFDGTLWLLGGTDKNGDDKNDIWQSNNGQNWTETTANAAFPERYFHTLITDDTAIYLIGGLTMGINPYNDVWVLD